MAIKSAGVRLVADTVWAVAKNLERLDQEVASLLKHCADELHELATRRERERGG